MICPLDLSVQQQHIYTLLYKRSDFNTMIVRYTAEQLALDSDSVLGITEKVARRILSQLKERGYIQELEKGKKGTYTKYRICKEIVINGQETGTYRAGIGQETGTNDKAIPTDADVDGQELGRKRAPIGQETVSPISNKDIKKIKKEKTFLSDSAEIRLSEHLFSRMKINNPTAKEPNWQVWARSIDLMIRVDNRTEDDIVKVIDWCQKDDFWKSNILSTSKLREKYDQLSVKINQFPAPTRRIIKPVFDPSMQDFIPEE